MKKIYILVRIGLYFCGGGGWREADFISGIWEAKAKYFQGAQDFFHGFGEIIAFFKEDRHPLGAT